MTEYNNNMRGVLFRNARRTNDNQPTMRGECEIDGRKWQISAWTKQIHNGPNAGEKMLSLAFQEPYDKQADRPTQPDSRQQASEHEDDGLPF